MCQCAYMPTHSKSKRHNAHTPELFVFLHGVLFTDIQLDNFSATLARLLECLDIEEPEGREWTMMAAVNIRALLEYSHQE